MHAQRTAGMTAIDIANIIFAAFGLALAVLGLACAALTMSLDVRQMIFRAQPDPETIRNLAVLMLPVVLFAALDLLLLLSGIRVLQLSPRGRTYSLVWAALALIAGAVDIGRIAWQPSWPKILLLPFALLTPAYGILLILLFRRSSWKQAFAV